MGLLDWIIPMSQDLDFNSHAVNTSNQKAGWWIALGTEGLNAQKGPMESLLAVWVV